MTDKQIKISCITLIALLIITLITNIVFSLLIINELYTLQEITSKIYEKGPTIILEDSEATDVKETSTDVETTTQVETTKPTETTTKVETEKPIKVNNKNYVSEEDIELIALVTVAEVESEGEYCKRLVIDTILNRVDHPDFPNTVRGVVYQKNQFSVMWNGRINRCVVTDDVRKLVREELESRTSYDVMFFQLGGYIKYGNPLVKVGPCYFSSY